MSSHNSTSKNSAEFRLDLSVMNNYLRVVASSLQHAREVVEAQGLNVTSVEANYGEVDNKNNTIPIETVENTVVETRSDQALDANAIRAELDRINSSIATEGN